MFNRLKQLKILWNLSRKSKGFQEFLTTVTNEELQSIPDEETKATFLPDGTEEEYDKWVREEIHGWKHFDRMIDKLIKNNE